MRIFLTAAILAASAQSSLAASSDGGFAVDGIGDQSCGDFVAVLDADDRTMVHTYAGWTNGFLTAVNVFRDGIFDITPWQTTPLIMGKLRAYCSANEDIAFVLALGSLVKVLAADALAEPSELAQVRADGRAVALPRAVLIRLPDALGRQGVADADQIDLDDPDSLVSALTVFQQQEGLAATGLPDQDTLNRLFP